MNKKNDPKPTSSNSFGNLNAPSQHSCQQNLALLLVGQAGSCGERQHPLPCLAWGERKGLKGSKNPKAQEQGAARALGTSTRNLLEATGAGSCCDSHPAPDACLRTADYIPVLAILPQLLNPGEGDVMPLITC